MPGLPEQDARTAREMLRQGVTPAEAALRSGFADQNHFTHFFKRFTGLTPARYQGIFSASAEPGDGRGEAPPATPSRNRTRRPPSRTERSVQAAAGNAGQDKARPAGARGTGEGKNGGQEEHS